jgi:acyl dehydratase
MLTLDQVLPTYEVRAHNYAIDADNKIHSDDVAARYGFMGGLVPGVGNYAYMTHPVVETLGRAWLERGTMAAKFIQPVYHGDLVSVRRMVTSVEPVVIQLELFNSAGTLCAVGNASLPATLPAFNPNDYPAQPLPEQLRAATISAVPTGTVLGALDFVLDLAGEGTAFLDKVVESAPLYRIVNVEDALCHPAYWPAQANELLMRNVALGPWIHTATEAQHYALARQGEQLSLRGRVAAAYEKRGHEFVELDLALFGTHDRPITRLKHTAIIKLRENR